MVLGRGARNEDWNSVQVRIPGHQNGQSISVNMKWESCDCVQSTKFSIGFGCLSKRWFETEPSLAPLSCPFVRPLVSFQVTRFIGPPRVARRPSPFHLTFLRSIFNTPSRINELEIKSCTFFMLESGNPVPAWLFRSELMGRSGDLYSSRQWRAKRRKEWSWERENNNAGMRIGFWSSH